MRSLPITFFVLAPLGVSQFPAGAVALVANNENVLSAATVGYADIAASKKMQADSVFWIASQIKRIVTVWRVLHGRIPLDVSKVQRVFKNWSKERYQK